MFVGADELPDLVAGLRELLRQVDQWRSAGRFESAECVFAWHPALVFGLARHGIRESGFLESRTLSRYFTLTAYEIGSLCLWLERAIGLLQ